MFTIYCPYCKETILAIENQRGNPLDLEKWTARCGTCNENVTPLGEEIPFAGYAPFQSRDHTSLALPHSILPKGTSIDGIGS